MSRYDSYVIEIDEDEVGLLLRQGSGFVFHAVAPRFAAFEGRAFADPWAAERALRGADAAALGPLNRGRRAG